MSERRHYQGYLFVYWRASETLTGVKMKKSGMFVYLFIYMDVRMSFCSITLEIELFTALNCFAGAVKTQNLTGAPFLFELWRW